MTNRRWCHGHSEEVVTSKKVVTSKEVVTRDQPDVVVQGAAASEDEAAAEEVAPPPAIQVSGLWKRYGDVAAVRGLDFTVAQAETFGFLGPNGAGKSTTVRMLTTLLSITSGDRKSVV